MSTQVASCETLGVSMYICRSRPSYKHYSDYLKVHQTIFLRPSWWSDLRTFGRVRWSDTREKQVHKCMYKKVDCLSEQVCFRDVLMRTWSLEVLATFITLSAFIFLNFEHFKHLLRLLHICTHDDWMNMYNIWETHGFGISRFCIVSTEIASFSLFIRLTAKP